MEDTLITFETAKLAKEKEFVITQIYWFNKQGIAQGFNTDPLDDVFYRPTQSLLQKWLREVHQTDTNIIFNSDAREYSFECIKWVNGVCNIYKSSGFETYEEALEVGLQEALKLI
jgi:hypothetical protein